MVDVRLPDGTIVRNVPEGTTRSELMRRLQPEPPASPRRPSFGEAFFRAGIERFLSNAGATPAVIGNFLIDALTPRQIEGVVPGPLEAAAAGVRAVTGGRVDPAAAAEEVRAAPRGPIPRIAGTDILAAGETLATLPLAAPREEGQSFVGAAAEAVGERFGEARETQARLLEEAQQTRPVATALGGGAGDVATILAGRAPLAGRLRTFEARRATLPLSTRQPGLIRQLDDIFRSRFGRALERTGLRVGEAGIEGAALAVLDEGDPVRTAALAAGGQALGSSLIGLESFIAGSGGMFSRRGAARIGATALLAGGVIQVLKEKTPGGQDRILESLEQGAVLVGSAMFLGALGVMAGTGRVGGRFQQDLPLIADAVTAVPRGALISLAKELTKTDEATAEFERTLSAIVENPDQFTAGTLRRVDQAFRSGKLPQEINRLMRNQDFRQRLERLTQ